MQFRRPVQIQISSCALRKFEPHIRLTHSLHSGVTVTYILMLAPLHA
jgi:hypothetical protein